MKKIFACALCVVMTVSLCSCAGCRKKEETKAKEKETIELWHYWDIPDNQRHLEELVEQFNKMQEDIEIEVSYIPDEDLKKQLALAMSEEKMPDIAVVDSSDFQFLHHMKAFADLTDAIPELKEYNEEKHIVEKTIVELEEKLNITDCTEELKFTPKDILIKRDIDFINKIKLDKEYQEKTKTWKDYTREEKADLIMRYVEDIELTLVGNELILKQINFRDSICKPCQELYDKGYIDITKPMILGNVLGSVRFSNYLPDEEVCEIIMRLQQYYDVHFTEATYYLQKQMFYFNFAEDNSAIVRVFPLEDYYKLDPNNKMEKYRFGILYINEEDKFEMQDIDTAFDYIPDESNDSVIYMKEPVPISVGVKPVKFCEDNTEEKN